MKSPEIIGVVGANGSLGSQMTAQILAKCPGVPIIGSDKGASELAISNQAIDRNICRFTYPADGILKLAKDNMQVLDTANVVHWCAPLDALVSITEVSKDCLLILHDSVMANSVDAVRQLQKNAKITGEVAIAHCLMNKHRRVIIGHDTVSATATMRAVEHFELIGLDPVMMKSKKHDYIAAHTQGLLALLIKSFKPALESYALDGNLTPSGEAFLEALNAREARWTKETQRSLLKNEGIKKVVKELLANLSPRKKK